MAKNDIKIIYEDERLLVINKPTGISVTADRSGKANLKEVLAEQLADDAEIRLIHRLDKDTSGVLLLAKDKQTQSILSGMFTKHLIRKTYLAIVTGAVGRDRGSVRKLIAPSTKEPGKMYIPNKHGKPSQTLWRLVADFGLLSLLAVFPVTGRTHQIRIHMPSVGLPLTVDPMYGTDKPLMLSDIKKGYRLGKDQEEKPLIDRLTLHAYQIDLLEKIEGLPGQFVAPLDKNFLTAVKMLTKHNAKGKEAFLNEADYEAILAGAPLTKETAGGRLSAE